METYKGFKINDYVKTTKPVTDEYDHVVPVGTFLKLVAIAPKVRITEGPNNDRLPYFYNAVNLYQDNDYHNRIRADFCTIEKLTINKSCL